MLSRLFSKRNRRAQSALAVDDACTPRGVTAREIGRVDTAACEECEETDAAVAEGVETPMPLERHSDGVREREGRERVKRGGNTLWQATCHQEVPRYRHPVAIVLTATSDDKGRLYERGNWDISTETRQAIADMATIDDTGTGRKETMTITPVTKKRRNTQTSKKKTLLKASEGIEKMRKEDTTTKRKKTLTKEVLEFIGCTLGHCSPYTKNLGGSGSGTKARYRYRCGRKGCHMTFTQKAPGILTPLGQASGFEQREPKKYTPKSVVAGEEKEQTTPKILKKKHVGDVRIRFNNPDGLGKARKRIACVSRLLGGADILGLVEVSLDEADTELFRTYLEREHGAQLWTHGCHRRNT